MSEKQDLLELHDKEQEREENLSIKSLFIALLALCIGLCVFLPKIYIANQIYYISREITEISNQRDVLLEENRALKTKLENLKYKINILNPLQDEQWK
ncbi:hypothetical protein [Campylobacter mucosalis]|uniref:Septum formation initiator n=1 Tax=Campylobacter mucosalis CCUG 21559 TaxID=1032067 RepID=A0A6G5QI51_9BACT|nr:hypothetical protein [Campylobacter mucosalis]KEA46351.1 membrane protein [Campylobacter mucosalis]QCD45257.1 hypothetical protein CMUC_1497 [Campylobacter mucosalis CCUG 21559]QKF63171.1 hypothetical protein CMCT_1038 [Campylobacter mucosalis]